MRIGCHVKMTSPLYLEGSVKEALSYHANAMMLYTGAPQNTRRSPIESMHVEEANALMAANGIPMDRMIIHAPYLINPANSVKPEVVELAGTFLQSELDRTKAIGASILVLHPGAYTTTDPITGIQTCANTLNHVTVPEGVVIALETMAGKGSEIGRTFEELADIFKQLEHPEKFGICLDTCHLNDSGIDLSDFDSVLDQFDEMLGLSRLRVIHLNDSKNEIGSHSDRHANIGLGTIGFDRLLKIAQNPRTESIVKILETPYIDGKPPYAKEIEMLQTGIYDSGWETKL